MAKFSGYVRISSFLVLQFLVTEILAQNRIEIDLAEDIPADGSWDIDCDNGYQEYSWDYHCENNGDGIEIPEEDLNGERGFWTKCEAFPCKVIYRQKPDDVSFKARIYQKNVQTEVSYDGVSWEYIRGQGWIDISKDLESGSSNEITMSLQHFSPDTFSILDKIVINGDFTPTTTTTPTETSTTPTETSTAPTETSTAPTETSTAPTETSTAPTETSTSPTETSTAPTETSTAPTETSTAPTETSTTPTETSTTPTETTTTPTETSTMPSETSTAPTETSTAPTETSTAPTETSTAPTETSTAPTETSTTLIFPSTMASDSSTTPTESSTEDPPTPIYCPSPPCSTTAITTTTQKSKDPNFFTGKWGILMFSLIGLSFLFLLCLCCIRCCCYPGAVTRPFAFIRMKAPPPAEMEKATVVQNQDHTAYPIEDVEKPEGDRYLYMYRYPYLLTYPETYTKPKILPNQLDVARDSKTSISSIQTSDKKFFPNYNPNNWVTFPSAPLPEPENPEKLHNTEAKMSSSTISIGNNSELNFAGY